MFLPWNRNLFHFLSRNRNLITPWEKVSSAQIDVALYIYYAPAPLT